MSDKILTKEEIIEELNGFFDEIRPHINGYNTAMKRFQNAIYAIKQLNPVSDATQKGVVDAIGLLQGFVNAYDVLNYNINPELIRRTKEFLKQSPPTENDAERK